MVCRVARADSPSVRQARGERCGEADMHLSSGVGRVRYHRQDDSRSVVPLGPIRPYRWHVVSGIQYTICQRLWYLVYCIPARLASGILYTSKVPGLR